MSILRKSATPTDAMKTRLTTLDARIKRMRQLHGDTGDALAHRLIGHVEAERNEVLVKLKD